MEKDRNEENEVKEMKTIMSSEVNGEISAPASKSMMIRTIAAIYLSQKKCLITNACFSDDCLTAIDVIKRLGMETKRIGKDLEITNINIKPDKNKMIIEKDRLNCNESGLCIRMFPPILALTDRKFTLEGSGSLIHRPISMLQNPLMKLGAKCETNAGFTPITIQGPLTGGHIKIDGSTTSQFLTGLLMALPKCKCRLGSKIEVKNLKSKPYIEMTLGVLKDFKVKIFHDEKLSLFTIPGNQKYKSPGKYKIEGDWSGASFLLIAAAISGKVKVKNLELKSTQADRAILDVLEKIGCKIKYGENYVVVEKAKLNKFEFDATHCPDLFPPLVALAANCKGTSRIKGVERLKGKESNRANALKKEFSKIGTKIKIYKDWMIIEGGEVIGGTTESHNDHRIAMACAVAGINSKKGVKVKHEKCVSKSYSNFFEDLKKIGVCIK